MTFSMSQKVLFRHCDPAGIVFFPQYFEMMNDCTELFFDSLGHPFETILPEGGVPTVQIETRFAAPSRHGDTLEIQLDCLAVGRSSVTFAIAASADGQTRFTARTTIVHVDGTGKSAAWPPGLRTALDAQTKGHS